MSWQLSRTWDILAAGRVGGFPASHIIPLPSQPRDASRPLPCQESPVDINRRAGGMGQPQAKRDPGSLYVPKCPSHQVASIPRGVRVCGAALARRKQRVHFPTSSVPQAQRRGGGYCMPAFLPGRPVPQPAGRAWTSPTRWVCICVIETVVPCREYEQRSDGVQLSRGRYCWLVAGWPEDL